MSYDDSFYDACTGLPLGVEVEMELARDMPVIDPKLPTSKPNLTELSPPPPPAYGDRFGGPVSDLTTTAANLAKLSGELVEIVAAVKEAFKVLGERLKQET